MSIKVKGLFEDIGGAGRVTELRRKKLANASSRPDPRDPIRELADRLHPAEMKFRCVSVTDASPSAKTFRFESVDGHIPVFQCGQFVNFRLRIGESLLTRPYTISSAPYEARGEKPFFEIIVRRNVPYLVPDYLFENVKPGDVLDGALPFGTFYWEPLRDTKNIVALAGGSGITPFFSMAEAIADGIEDFELTILYGSRTAEGILLREELDAVAARSGGRVKVVHVLSDEEREGYEHGFLTAELVRKYAPEGDYSVFMCGPQAMYDYEERELQKLGLPRRRIRRELSGDCIMSEPAKVKYKLTLDIHGYRRTIDCLANESLEWAIERAGIKAPTHCRSGECGWCHARLVSGEVFVPERADGRRGADLKFGWLHPCASFPRSDVELEIFPG